MRKSILETIHEEAKGLHDAGLINTTTMRKFDAHCLEPTKKMSRQDVKRIRLRIRASQPVFATYLNVTPSAVKQWEVGEKHPSGASLRLLQLIDRGGLAVFKPIQTVGSTRKSLASAPRKVVAGHAKKSRKELNEQDKRKHS